MSRYIDADALKAWFFRPYSNEESYCNMDVAKAIDNAPTVDAVTVVRCAKCKWCEYPVHNSTKYGCRLFDRCVKPDWFCADGERRSDEDQHIYD